MFTSLCPFASWCSFVFVMHWCITKTNEHDALMHHTMLKGLSHPLDRLSCCPSRPLQMYSQLMRNFIIDDHDFTVCAAAESVQIFTVPTLVGLPPFWHSDLSVFFVELPRSPKRLYSGRSRTSCQYGLQLGANVHCAHIGRLCFNSVVEAGDLGQRVTEKLGAG